MSSNNNNNQIIEQDTEENEDISNLFNFLLPFTALEEFGGRQYTQFSVSFNQNIFQGWVKQPSPCCAAAAVAGAWNAIHHYSRNHDKAYQYHHILAIYVQIIEEKIEKKTAAFHRKLGYIPSNKIKINDDEKESEVINSLDQVDLLSDRFWTRFDELCHSIFQKQATGKKETITKKVVDKAMKKIIRELLDEFMIEMDRPRIISWKDIEGDPSINRSFPYFIAELYEAEEKSVFEEIAEDQVENEEKVGKKTSEEDEKVAEEEEEAEEDEEDGEKEDELGNNEGKPSTLIIIEVGPGKSSKSKKKWDWRKDFIDIAKARGGIKKLQRPKPSTAYIGNWGILEAMEHLSQQFYYGDNLTARMFMGKKKLAKSKIDFPLLKKDKDETIQLQWEGIKSVFNRPNHVLLFHLKNHYALVFALREWFNCEDGKYYRQMLTARKGQRPTAWIDFNEAREIMLSWEGYKMILITGNIESIHYIEYSEASKRK